MTKEQIYHRRLARKYGKKAIEKIASCLYHGYRDYRGVHSPYMLAKESAWHAFRAQPELRESTIAGSNARANEYWQRVGGRDEGEDRA